MHQQGLIQREFQSVAFSADHLSLPVSLVSSEIQAFYDNEDAIDCYCENEKVFLQMATATLELAGIKVLFICRGHRTTHSLIKTYVKVKLLYKHTIELNKSCVVRHMTNEM